nr:immunoglobulin heavy chain junction region [Macaca mulatta]MOV49452.1 immunoglobulin heavy chain junction region [Macaca mulatta]MOV50820.1 immunoglobulin heavy chain junction region [Macaca mulatta]MOV50884.1 immunoglobulin heavy chain junction region [Macaca mulatta]MOV51927.1 immunoglobulin heavy chain junction region [Macaca mulatta]
CVRVNTEFDYW